MGPRGLLGAFALVAALSAHADADRLWTTVGSAGTLDEKSEGKVFFNRGVVQKGTTGGFSSSFRRPQAEGDGGVDVTDSAVIRYNVTAVDGLFGEHLAGMTIRFLAQGGARVTAELIEVDLASGAEVTLLTFDSNASPQQGGYHVDSVFAACSKAEPFDFLKKAYYIEATLTNSAIIETSAAGIEIIQLSVTPCLR